MIKKITELISHPKTGIIQATKTIYYFLGIPIWISIKEQ